MHQKQKINSVLNLLRKSVESNLNAALTPDECRLLLGMVSRMKGPITPSKQTTPLNKIVNGLTDLGKEFLDDLSSEIMGNPPERKKRK